MHREKYIVRLFCHLLAPSLARGHPQEQCEMARKFKQTLRILTVRTIFLVAGQGVLYCSGVYAVLPVSTIIPHNIQYQRTETTP